MQSVTGSCFELVLVWSWGQRPRKLPQSRGKGSGFRVQRDYRDLGFRDLGFRDLGFRIQGRIRTGSVWM